jgi:hypothetical protein
MFTKKYKMLLLNAVILKHQMKYVAGFDNGGIPVATWSINEYIAKVPVIDGSIAMNSFFAIPCYFLVKDGNMYGIK